MTRGDGQDYMTVELCEERHKNVMGKLGSLEMMTSEIYKKMFLDNGESWSTQIKLSTEHRLAHNELVRDIVKKVVWLGIVIVVLLGANIVTLVLT